MHPQAEPGNEKTWRSRDLYTTVLHYRGSIETPLINTTGTEAGRYRNLNTGLAMPTSPLIHR